MESIDEKIARLESRDRESRLMTNEIRFLCRYGDVTTWRASGTIMRYPEVGQGEMVKIFGDGPSISEAVSALERRFVEVCLKRWGDSSVG